jgi:UDP-glucose 4-epimerase
MTPRRRVLITGGEGFIGANLARRLADDGEEVHILARPNPERKWKLLDLLGVKAPVHTVDLLDRDGVAAAVAAVRPHHVFHLAGRVDLERSSAMARLCIQENVVTTVNLLDALQGVAVEAVVYTSTTEVYGAGPTPFHEEQALDPPSPYSVSKVAGESFCRLWAQTFGCPARIVRMASAYGPGQGVQRLVPSVVLAGLRGERLLLRSPYHRRDYLFVADAVDGIVRAARTPLPAGTVLNLGLPDAHTVRDLAARVLEGVGRPDLPIEFGEGRLNESPCWTTGATKARDVLGWNPSVGLADGLARTIAWYRGLVARDQA